MAADKELDKTDREILRLLAMDAVNRPADFMLAKRALAQLCTVDVERLADDSVPLKELLQSAPVAPAI